jgi:hypothetical protein
VAGSTDDEALLEEMMGKKPAAEAGTEESDDDLLQKMMGKKGGDAAAAPAPAPAPAPNEESEDELFKKMMNAGKDGG